MECQEISGSQGCFFFFFFDFFFLIKKVSDVFFEAPEVFKNHRWVQMLLEILESHKQILLIFSLPSYRPTS